MGARAWRRRNGGLSLVQRPLSWCMGRVPSAWRGARARRKRTHWASSLERASVVARKRATRASHLALLKGGLARGSTGLAPVERRPPARAVPFRSIWAECRRLGAARARVGSTRAGLVPERASAVARKHATRASHLALLKGWLACGSTGLAPMERRPPAGAVPFHRAWTEYRQRGAARARVGIARAGPRPQR